MTEQQPNGADFIVSRLLRWGVDRVYGYPGDGNNALVGAMRRSQQGKDRVDFTQARHEEAAAFMAVGHAKYSGQVGVVTATQGPGAIHLLNGLYDAKLDSVPVVALIGQQPTTTLGSGDQQEADLHTLFQDVASFTLQVSSAEQLPLALDKAFRRALSSSGPSVVIVPQDVQSSAAPEIPHEHGYVQTTPVWRSPTVMPAESDLKDAAEILGAGEKVAFLVGQGARGCGPQVLEFAEKLGAGVTTSLLGKPHVEEDHPLVAGTMGHLGTTASAQVLLSCDTLVIIGSNDPWTEYYPVPGSCRTVQIDNDPAKLGNHYPIDVGIVGDAAATVGRLSALVEPRSGSDWSSLVRRLVTEEAEIAARRSEVPMSGVNPESAARQLSQHLPDDALLAIDVGSSVYWYVRQMQVPPNGTAHLSSTLASMGCSIPYGIAAKNTASNQPVVVLSGDGAMQMLGVNELISVARIWRQWEDPRFVVVVLNNGDLGEVSWEQREKESEPRFPASQALPEFDYAQYAELNGLRGITVNSPEQLAQAYREAFTADRPVVIDVHTDADAPVLPPVPYSLPKTSGMKEAMAAESDGGERPAALMQRYLELEQDRHLPTELSGGAGD
ncbi:thiamine pyrophosphate-requiring protein [Nesterenkonia lutea]|uniref:Pyruvate dehydrogenase (Quinone) n=1 Tax=Nesterenkonia lutea TaxID=272919 RepID=A0ABR9JDK9_9MICC|nr:thiamine pyrophosphate-requiring protein [Nesterenkonia lutea]MBE1524009.1 pyruvate dehydrogenase (quinone) [Nesterenkonia lutea]